MSYPSRLVSKTALITGGSRGIGRAVALRFASEGARVAITHLNDPEKASQTIAQMEAASAANGYLAMQHVAFDSDAGNSAAIRLLARDVIEHFGRLDILVNNAGIQAPTPSAGFDETAFQQILSVNLTGIALLCQHILAHFASRPGGGTIINTSSVHEIIPKPGYLAYSLAKGGLGNLTRTLALEGARQGIRVNAVGPGAITTDMNSAWTGDAEARAAVEEHIPMGRAGSPEELAPLFAFLASDEASYITGQTIYACGGLTLFGDFRSNWAS